jgi:hypothetical protein
MPITYLILIETTTATVEMCMQQKRSIKQKLTRNTIDLSTHLPIENYTCNSTVAADTTWPCSQQVKIPCIQVPFLCLRTVDRQLPRPTGRERRQLREAHGKHAVLELRLCVLEVCVLWQLDAALHGAI